MVSVVEPDPPTIEFEPKEPVTPEGKPERLRRTVPLNPLLGAILIVYVVLAPALMVREEGDAEIVKSGFCCPAQARIEALTLSRPPVVVIPAMEAMWSTLARRLAFSWSVERLHAESTNAAAPETCGVAIEVPLRNQ